MAKKKKGSNTVKFYTMDVSHDARAEADLLILKDEMGVFNPLIDKVEDPSFRGFNYKIKKEGLIKIAEGQYVISAIKDNAKANKTIRKLMKKIKKMAALSNPCSVSINEAVDAVLKGNDVIPDDYPEVKKRLTLINNPEKGRKIVVPVDTLTGRMPTKRTSILACEYKGIIVLFSIIINENAAYIERCMKEAQLVIKYRKESSKKRKKKIKKCEEKRVEEAFKKYNYSNWPNKGMQTVGFLPNRTDNLVDQWAHEKAKECQYIIGYEVERTPFKDVKQGDAFIFGNTIYYKTSKNYSRPVANGSEPLEAGFTAETLATMNVNLIKATHILR